MPYLGVFGLELQKLLSYWKSAPSNLSKNESLTHTMNFGIGCAFSKGPGSAFSEGPGPLYKVCRVNLLKVKFLPLILRQD